MNCEETGRLLEASLDGELDLMRQVELEDHVRTCPNCGPQVERAKALRKAMLAALPRYPAPAALRQRIRTALAPEVSFRPRIGRPAWEWAGLAALVALGSLAGFVGGSARTRANQLFAEAFGDHVRSLQGAHLLDVASTDQHTVRPWFAGRLDFAPPAVDLAPAGFPLAGGRLERLDGRTAAALVYYRRRHAINLLVWPAHDAALAEGSAERTGYQAATWSHAGLNFLAVSEIPSAELRQFTQAFRAATE